MKYIHKFVTARLCAVNLFMNLNKKFKVGVHYNSRLLCMFKDGLYPAVFSRARIRFFYFFFDSSNQFIYNFQSRR
jgi:hypothetical protein